jgi:hypothetical protein
MNKDEQALPFARARRRVHLHPPPPAFSSKSIPEFQSSNLWVKFDDANFAWLKGYRTFITVQNLLQLGYLETLIVSRPPPPASSSSHLPTPSLSSVRYWF